jgi:hypothetical protein
MDLTHLSDDDLPSDDRRCQHIVTRKVASKPRRCRAYARYVDGFCALHGPRKGDPNRQLKNPQPDEVDSDSEQEDDAEAEADEPDDTSSADLQKTDDSNRRSDSGTDNDTDEDSDGDDDYVL